MKTGFASGVFVLCRALCARRHSHCRKPYFAVMLLLQPGLVRLAGKRQRCKHLTPSSSCAISTSADGSVPAQFPDVCFGGGPHADRGAPLAAEMEHVFPVLELQFAQVKLQSATGSLVCLTWQLALVARRQG